MQSNQRFLRYRVHKLLGWLLFSKCPPLLFSLDSSKKIIRSSEIPREQDLNAIQPTFHKISPPQAFFSSHFLKMSTVSHFVFNNFFPKGIQIIINTNRTTTPTSYSDGHLVFNRIFPKVNN